MAGKVTRVYLWLYLILSLPSHSSPSNYTTVTYDCMTVKNETSGDETSIPCSIPINSTEHSPSNSRSASGGELLAIVWIAENVFNPPIILIGIGGNIANIIIMTRKPFQHLAISVLLIFLALSDTGTLLMYPFNKKNFRLFLGGDPRALSWFGCHLFFTCFRTTKLFSSWVLVLIAIERFMAIWFFSHAAKFNTRKNALIALLVVLLCIFLYTSVWSAYTDIIMNGVCIPNSRQPGHEQRTRVLLIIGVCLLCFLPAMLMLVVNGLILYRLCVPVHGQQGYVNDKVRARFMLLAVTLSFFILLTPIAVAHLTFHALDKNIFEETDPVMITVREMAQVLELLNSSINFFLYTISSKSFRREIFRYSNFKCGSSVQPYPVT